MGVFRRHEPSAAEKAMQARFAIGAADPAPAPEQCWFCGAEVDDEAEAGALTIEPLESGEAQYGVCHLACAERAKGSLVRPDAG